MSRPAAGALSAAVRWLPPDAWPSLPGWPDADGRELAPDAAARRRDEDRARERRRRCAAALGVTATPALLRAGLAVRCARSCAPIARRPGRRAARPTDLVREGKKTSMENHVSGTRAGGARPCSLTCSPSPPAGGGGPLLFDSPFRQKSAP